MTTAHDRIAAIKASLSDDALWDEDAAVDDTYVAVNALRTVSGPAALRAIVEHVEQLEREVNEQARLLGISGSVEARLRAQVAELERQIAEAQQDARKLKGER